MAHPKRAVSEPRTGTAYEVDLVAWSCEQATHMRQRDWSKLDLPHLIDEVEALGRAERNALTSALRIVLLHMLKWDHQPGHRTHSWATSIRVQRLAVQDGLADSPSLARQIDELLERAYRRARIEAAAETNFPENTFPGMCPYSVDQLLNRDFPWPPPNDAEAGISS